MQIPIACRLSDTAARAQLGEWRELLASSAVAALRLSPTELAWQLGDDLGRLDAIVRLAQREQACCAFFEFVIRIDAGSVSLHVSVPADAAAILDQFALLGPG